MVKCVIYSLISVVCLHILLSIEEVPLFFVCFDCCEDNADKILTWLSVFFIYFRPSPFFSNQEKTKHESQDFLFTTRSMLFGGKIKYSKPIQNIHIPICSLDEQQQRKQQK